VLLPELFSPVSLSDVLTARNRFAMAAMTRGFADKQHRATPAIAEYYRKRAAGGTALILTEGVVIHPSADGYNDVPHIANDEQAASWKPVIEGVHKEGALIACQLWHCGRISHSDYTGGLPPVSSTNRAAEGINRQNGKPFGTPVALDEAGIRAVYGQFVDAAKRALGAGFDAVQLHCGHGYLADQFLDARVNDRTDRYGGSVENRCRFVLELLEATLAAVPANRVMMRISPSRFMGSLYDWPDLEEMVSYLLPRLWERGLRMLDISCANANYFDTSGRVIRMARPLWPGIILGGASLKPEDAAAEVRAGLLDLVTWGRFMIANPDLAARVREGKPLAEFSYDTLKELV